MMRQLWLAASFGLLHIAAKVPLNEVAVPTVLPQEALAADGVVVDAGEGGLSATMRNLAVQTLFGAANGVGVAATRPSRAAVATSGVDADGADEGRLGPAAGRKHSVNAPFGAANCSGTCFNGGRDLGTGVARAEAALAARAMGFEAGESTPNWRRLTDAPFGASNCEGACFDAAKDLSQRLTEEVVCKDSNDTVVECIDIPVAFLASFSSPTVGGAGIAGYLGTLWYAHQINLRQQLLPGHRIVIDPFNSHLLVAPALEQLVKMGRNRERWAAIIATDAAGSEAVINNWQDRTLNLMGIFYTNLDVSLDQKAFPQVVSTRKSTSQLMLQPVVALAPLVGWRHFAVVTSTGEDLARDNTVYVEDFLRGVRDEGTIDDYLVTTVLWNQTGRVDMAPNGGAAARILQSNYRILLFQAGWDPLVYVMCELFRAGRRGYTIFIGDAGKHSHWWLDPDHLRENQDTDPRIKPTANGCTFLQIASILVPIRAEVEVVWVETGSGFPPSNLTCTPDLHAYGALGAAVAWSGVNFPHLDPTNIAVPGYSGATMDMICMFALAANKFLVTNESLVPVDSAEDLMYPTEEVREEMTRLLQNSRFSGYWGTNGDVYLNGGVSRQYPLATCIPRALSFTCFGWYTDGTLVPIGQPVWYDGKVGFENAPRDRFPDCNESTVRWGEDCVACAESQVYLPEFETCTCRAGYRLNASYVGWDHPSMQCEPCGPGYISKQTGRAVCTPCSPGTFSNETNGTVCKVCPEGTYQAESGQDSCTPCREGFINSGRTSESQCACPPGRFWYKSTQDAEAVCEPCPLGLSCPGGIGAPLSAEWFRGGLQTYRGSLPSFLVKCQSAAACPEGAALDTCPPHREGIACNRCVVGHYEVDDECKPCEGGNTAWPLVLLLVFAFVALGTLCAYATRGMRVRSASLMTMTITAGLIVNTLQSLGAFRQINISWPEPMKSIYAFTQLFTINIDLLNPGCVFSTNSPALKYLGSVCAPVVAIIILLVMFSLGRFVSKKVTLNQAFNMIGFLALSWQCGLSIIAVHPWQCELNPDGTSSVVSERDILCYEGEHNGMLVISLFAILLYIVSFFAVIIWTTWVHSRRIMLPGGIAFLNRFHFLFDRFAPEFYWFGVVYCVRNLIVALLPVLFANDVALQLLLMTFVFSCYLCVVCSIFPWRSQAPSYVDAGSSVGLIMILLAGTLLVDTTQGSTETIVTTFFMVVVLLLVAMALVTLAYSSFHAIFPPKTFAAFLCHHKVGTAVLARWLKMEFTHQTSAEIFLDSDNLVHLDTLFETVAFNTRNLVVLMSRQLLERIWCAGEITTALQYGVNMVRIAYDDYLEPSDGFIDDLDSLWTEDQKTHLGRLGIGVQQIQTAYQGFRQKDCIRWDRTKPWERQVDHVPEVISRCTGMLLAHVTSRAATTTAAATTTREQIFGQGALMIVGEHSEPENLCLCVIVQGRLQQELELSTGIADFDADSTEQMAKAECIVPLLTKGVLGNAGWAKVVMEAINNGVMAIPVVADSGFAFPGPSFWAELEEGRGPVGASLREQGLDSAAVGEAYQTLFSCIAAHITPHGSESGLRLEIADIARRYRFNSVQAAHASLAGRRGSLGSDKASSHQQSMASHQQSLVNADGERVGSKGRREEAAAAQEPEPAEAEELGSMPVDPEVMSV